MSCRQEEAVALALELLQLFAGVLAEERPPGAGGDFSAESGESTSVGRLGEANDGSQYGSSSMCFASSTICSRLSGVTADSLPSLALVPGDRAVGPVLGSSVPFHRDYESGVDLSQTRRSAIMPLYLDAESGGGLSQTGARCAGRPTRESEHASLLT
jgi:hypothetical protein